MSTRQIAYAAVLAALYVVVGQVVRYLPNPMVPGAIIALNMVVVVIAGILLGPAAGALVGLVGTGINGFFTPAGNAFERVAVIPHAVMGLAAGVVGRRSVLAGAFTILVGHALNILGVIAAGLLPASEIAGAVFVYGLAFETVVDVVVILLAVPLLRPLVTRT
ncbi:MAG: ECF transporter S component [Armatimonadota bacterium]|nr:ECF transporter S component [Armatimonadota bacterium]